jgi:hypothetical protein
MRRGKVEQAKWIPAFAEKNCKAKRFFSSLADEMFKGDHDRVTMAGDMVETVTPVGNLA